MKIPLKYIYRNIMTRKLTTGITIFGVAMVVFVFTAVLMMAFGIQKTLKSTGSTNNVHVSRKAASGEISSIIDGETQRIIMNLPHIAKNSKGQMLVSSEPVVIANLEIKTGGLSNVAVRGVSETIFEVRPHVKIIKGRSFNFGSRELIVGRAIEKKFKNASIGNKIKIAGDYWTVTGIFDTDGSGFDSEIWGDALQLLNAFNRPNSYSTITLKLDDPNNFEEFRKAFENERRLQQYVPKIEQKYFEEQSEMMATFIRILGIVITIIFSFGATIGAMITMYAAVANRTVEIGTLRALGFKRRNILLAFLLESLLITVIAWVIGQVMALFLSFQKVSTLNFASFSELEFGFALSPEILLSSLIFSLGMGLLGGFLPAVRASRMNIVNALRSA